MSDLNGHTKGETIRSRFTRVYFKLAEISHKLDAVDTIPVELASISKSIARIARNDLIKMLIVATIVLLVVINDRKIFIKLGPLEIGHQVVADDGR
jgi:hypothetical protein